ncbi:hypothetical protein, partial [Chromobacterium haemolyticum]|uniref:hypothetical protein n=1 Tax=Chromobacterium haemolyticum TaxID=394935 RepID=UPI0019634914
MYMWYMSILKSFSTQYRRRAADREQVLRAANKTLDAALRRLAVLNVLSESARLASAVKLSFVGHSKHHPAGRKKGGLGRLFARLAWRTQLAW